ncbi:UDP-N-acetylglucosamine 1-carboxyvinyltransferase [Staphylococcus aureus]|uniref:UDP-N-acetylglucosamine 1-carboxyvinyltransferase n=1 Tax=Staphylococcus aureus TaxID=1280 RepID=A0A380DWM7_STAAU|nr:UDP-N-acetylglucosamine 1-carboxyvinyltransferase [Staphylococcus aureus]
MDKIVIKGGNKLTGEVKVEGAKKCSITNFDSIFISF